MGAVTELHATRTNPPWEGLEGTERHAACVIAAREGRKGALDVLVAELTPLVWHIARGAGLDRSAAEDVAQTVWLALLRHVDSIAEPRAVVGWLITTTRREAKRTRQRSATQFELPPEVAEHVPSTEPQPEAEALRTERDHTLWSAFHRLDQRCQELLRLTVLAGRAEYKVVAEVLRMPHGSIGPTRGRCLNALRALYDNGDGGR
ncbi:RNA polymerase sigma factor, sigma-70 family [Actinokineospora diospyrosa]|uniref:RNA polymerase sigma factor, sigma-70 family n=1 Tax=Actinokineospora diospyrosa TaxID=103728 RepID=A0ABT1IGV9_9PSEU|nr:RNA polymerase sigma factor, sigma-70 family [Actinokineospora diospyrosa]